MRHYLVLAHRTLGGEHLFEHLRHLREADPYCRFHVVVPEYHPTDHPWTEFEVRAAAEYKMNEMLDTMAAMGMGATGEVGDSNPVYAAATAMRHHGGVDEFTGIIVSTLPKRTSMWWHVPRRLSREFPNIPLVHLVAQEALVGV